MTLYLLPNTIHVETKKESAFVPAIEEVIYSMQGFFAEHPKIARQFLKHFDFDRLRDKPIYKYTDPLPELMEPLLKGESWGFVTDAGLACIADPGSKFVAFAKEHKIAVKSFVGPCSITLALQLSGIYAQQFSFLGYLPRHINKSIRQKGVQVFIQTPYKTESSIDNLVQVLQKNDVLSVAVNLMGKNETCITLPIHQWKSYPYKNKFQKSPAVFILQIA